MKRQTQQGLSVTINQPVGVLPNLISSDTSEPLMVWRGESSGDLFDAFDLNQTNARVGFFFAEQQELAAGYARLGTAPRSFHLQANNVLDLRDPYSREAKKFLKEYSGQFDEWVDRYSGESMDVHSFLESGSLYDYEGTGSAERWNRLFSEAWDQGFDAVRVFDSTDGIPMGVVWVVREAEQIVFAQPKELVNEPLGGRRMKF